jgi:drug/metabolite transporter (DMT)-like permease
MAFLSQGSTTAGLILGMLIFGSYNTMNIKFQFQTCVPTTDPKKSHSINDDHCPAGQVKFNKPWQTNMYMFIGEASLIVVYGITRRARLARSSGETSLSPYSVEQGLVAAPAEKLPLYTFAIPAFCDVFGTGLASVGMQYMDSAIWQMLRSSIIIFSAILSVLFLKRRLQPFHWVATCIVFCGLVLVGLASALDGSNSTSAGGASERLFGIVLVVGAQLCSAFQMVFEEKLLTGRAKTSAKKVVGMEGIWGGFYMVVILVLMNFVPGEDNGRYEALEDGIQMISSTPSLLILAITYMCSIAIYNLTGIIVGKKLSSVVRCLVDSCRTFVVWGLNLFIYYFVSDQYGSSLTRHSWLQLLGFMLLVFGTLMYNEVLPMPKCLTRPPPNAESTGDGSVLSQTGFEDILSKVALTDETDAREPAVR